MKTAVAVLFLVGFYAFASGQENAPTNHAVPPSVGLEIGQHAPAFALPDQFGHEHSKETLKGSKGTVLLFFAPPIGDPSARRSSCSCKVQSRDLRRRD